MPAAFRNIVINAVETGQVPKGSGGVAGRRSRPSGRSWPTSSSAAYGAFRTGLSISLVVAGVVILVSGLIAWVTLAPGRRRPELES